MLLDLMHAEVFCNLIVVGLVKTIIFDVDMSSSGHVDNEKKDILILGKSPR